MTAPKASGARAESARDDPATIGDSSFRWLVLRRFALRVPLPEVAEWTVDDKNSGWFIARHPGSGSELRLRTWSAVRSVTPEQCEAQARLWLPAIPAFDPGDAALRRPLLAPQGFHGQIMAGVALGRAAGELDGYALAFGAGLGRCYAAIFTTRARGDRAEERLGHSLAVIVGRVLERVTARVVDDRAPEPRFPF